MYSKIAIASYYLPDILFFISGFIFAKKGFTLIELENKPIKPLISNLVNKLWRLYPLYLLIIIIFWQISPTLHSGPIWYEYQSEAAQCNSSWWRVLLLIDNWF
jgi:peptidoglycan/LPS O-acetylase OafA/YrhL